MQLMNLTAPMTLPPPSLLNNPRDGQQRNRWHHSWRNVRSVVFVAAMLGLLSACQSADQQGMAVENALAYVDGEPVTSAMVDQFLALKGQKLADAQERKAALRELIRIQAVVNRAQEQNLVAENSEIAAELAINRQRVILNHFSKRFLQERPITEEELRKAYNTTVKRSGQQEVRMDSILFQDEQAAVSALLAAEEGTDFDTLMDESRRAGRQVEELDWINLSQVPEDYTAVVADIEAGAVVPVPLRDEVNGQPAWRVFRVVERRRFQPPAFEEVRPGLERQLRSEKLLEWSERLLSKSDVEMTDGSTFEFNSGENTATESADGE